LQYRYSEAAAELGKIQTLERENQELRKLLENSDRSYQSALITAPIVSFAQNFIAAGSQAGIRPGSAVLYKGTLLGLIDRVEEKQASVLLLSKLSDTRVWAETETGVTGLIQGNGREILLTEIKHDQSVAVGQLVFTASQVGIEKGLFIGKIARLSTTNQAQAVQTAVIEQIVNFYEVSLVEVR
jgi:cell shape-determining protein MreC